MGIDVILNLGVIDIPYNQPRGRRQKKPRAGNVTTGDVATFLEDKYHVLENFYQLHAEEVADDLAESLKGALETFMMGGPVSQDPFGSATSSIDDRMKQFIATGEMDRLGFPGVPTQAARDRAAGKRRSARFATRRATGQAVSFYDTGLYQASLKSWID